MNLREILRASSAPPNTIWEGPGVEDVRARGGLL